MLYLVSIELKTPFILHLVLFTRNLECFLYLRIASKVGSLTFSIIGSKLEYREMLRFFTILLKKLLKTSNVPFSIFTISSFSLNLSYICH